MHLGPGTRVQRATTTAWREIDGQVVVISHDVNRVRLLNDVGGFLWRLCDGVSFAALIEAVRAEYDVDLAPATEDVRCFLEDLAARGMISLQEAST